ncbi:CDP-glycerol glycerophosphotransferase family protein [Streptomyces sp. NRRL B-24484]|uniref:CDP-glycerol glycerophosphotransferase family protein n=1 Tax=Streptomyces sp. NRRL B-24484 TaxID=1463833 RepID=UPI000AD4984C|nr:CDP-glycerol glycerophosphotransferase family protein [Streptomyces sp. NRRL B-24484]
MSVNPAGAASPTEPRAVIRSLRWEDGRLLLTGFAHPQDRPAATRGSARTVLVLRRTGSRSFGWVGTRPVYLPESTEDSGLPELNHDWAGFTAAIDPARFRRRGAWTEGEWRVSATVFTGLKRSQGGFQGHWCGTAETPPAHWVADDVRVVPVFRAKHLRLRVERIPFRVRSAAVTEDALELAGAATGPVEGTALRLHRGEGDAGAVVGLTADGAGFTARIPLAVLTAGGAGTEAWQAELVHTDGRTEPLVVDERGGPVTGQFPLAGTADLLHVARDRRDGLELAVRPPVARVDEITELQDGFVLGGSTPTTGQGPLELVLRHSDGIAELRHPATATSAERFRATLPAGTTTAGGDRLPLRMGVWELLLRTADGAERPLTVAPSAFEALPATVTVGPKTVKLERRHLDSLFVDSSSVLTAEERSAFAQHRLRTVDYPAAGRDALREAVFYDVFGGRGYADSPGAVHRELVRRGVDVEHIWAVNDAQGQVPAGVRTVRVQSPEWYEALATSRYLVGNTHFPDFVERRPGQVVVQTWHGSLLKRIAHDVENAYLADVGYLEALDHETPHWSVLVSPSPFATPILGRAFRYEGEILQSGYPRNDLLATGDDALAAEVRARLGIPEGRRIVLYAPTWREDQQRDNGAGFRLDLQLDTEAARAALGEDHVLLVRPHAHVREPLPGAGDGFLYDVGDYPDVQELLLVADVLVTDYSSIMFDFAITGRPILFFTYDLERYRDVLRGFYFDFETEAPGPLIPTSEALVEALRDVTAATADHAERYAAFRALHCVLDDGKASARVVDRMLAG